MLYSTRMPEPGTDQGFNVTYARSLQVVSMTEEKEQPVTGILYQCISCGEKLTMDQLAMTPEIKCPFCGYRVLRKVRPPVVKRVKAR